MARNWVVGVARGTAGPDRRFVGRVKYIAYDKAGRLTDMKYDGGGITTIDYDVRYNEHLLDYVTITTSAAGTAVARFGRELARFWEGSGDVGHWTRLPGSCAKPPFPAVLGAIEGQRHWNGSSAGWAVNLGTNSGNSC